MALVAEALPTTQLNGKTEQLRGTWRSSDLDLLPESDVRYEIINGELFMARSPHWHHQETCGLVYLFLTLWSQQSGLGRANMTPGVIFTDADDVIPDVVWISNARLATLMDDAGHLTGAPELIVEVLSMGAINERRDREAKRKLYAAHGVREYWIVDWRLKQVEVYRREERDLRLLHTLFAGDELTSPLLPDFACDVARFFAI